MLNLLDKRLKMYWVEDGMFKFLKEIQHGADILTSTTKNGFYISHGEIKDGIMQYGSLIAEMIV